ncbi:MAG: hypothetical protein K6E75_06080 [Lachnospiraceae bacterium]|nr:hypothetical protein [Lachnospiraceae bacterium]
MDASIMELRLEQWKPIFEAQAKSGLNKQEWCQQNGIRRWEFFKRQKELRQHLLSQSSETLTPMSETTDLIPSATAFVELPMKSEEITQKAAAKTPVDGSIEISYGKFKIKLKGGVDRTTLDTVIKAVAHA